MPKEYEDGQVGALKPEATSEKDFPPGSGSVPKDENPMPNFQKVRRVLKIRGPEASKADNGPSVGNL